MFKNIFILLFCISSSFAQNINQYKYVEVPQRFDFQKENNRYNLNELTKLLLEKYGFVTFMDDEIKPEEAANNNCAMVLRLKVEEDSNAFVTKLTVHLLDCQNNTVYSTLQGTSRAKDRKVAYNQALRMAFESFDRLHYEYEEIASAKVMTVVVDPKDNSAINKKSDSAKAEMIAEGPSEKDVLTTSEKAAQRANSNASAKAKTSQLGNSANATTLNNSDSSPKMESSVVEFEFIAKAVENGFLLQSASLPEIRMQKSSVDNYYIAQIGDLPAMIYKVGNVWKLDFYKNGELQTKVISIKL